MTVSTILIQKAQLANGQWPAKQQLHVRQSYAAVLLVVQQANGVGRRPAICQKYLSVCPAVTALNPCLYHICKFIMLIAS